MIKLYLFLTVCICGSYCKSVNLYTAYQNCKVNETDINKFWADGEFPPGKDLNCTLACVAKETGVFESYFTRRVEKDRQVLHLRHALFSNVDLTKCVPKNFKKMNECDVAHTFFELAVKMRKTRGKKA